MSRQPHTSSGETVPVILGLLGGIASGKSTVAHTLEAAGARILDADRLARAALGLPEIRAALVERLGPGVVGPEGVRRGAVGEQVFGDPATLRWLEGLIHPRVREQIQEALDQHLRAGDVPAVVLDVPLLLETGAYEEECDLLLFVDCPEEIRRQRVEQLRGWTADELRRREAHQLPPARKRERADVVFSNSGTEAELCQIVQQWLEDAGGFAGLSRRISPPSARSAIHDERDENREPTDGE